LRRDVEFSVGCALAMSAISGMALVLSINEQPSKCTEWSDGRCLKAIEDELKKKWDHALRRLGIPIALEFPSGGRLFRKTHERVGSIMYRPSSSPIALFRNRQIQVLRKERCEEAIGSIDAMQSCICGDSARTKEQLR
jgi:hypothetical protein